MTSEDSFTPKLFKEETKVKAEVNLPTWFQKYENLIQNPIDVQPRHHGETLSADEDRELWL